MKTPGNEEVDEVNNAFISRKTYRNQLRGAQFFSRNRK
jgi:hypothetical protein